MNCTAIYVDDYNEATADCIRNLLKKIRVKLIVKRVPIKKDDPMSYWIGVKDERTMG